MKESRMTVKTGICFLLSIIAGAWIVIDSPIIDATMLYMAIPAAFLIFFIAYVFLSMFKVS
jgi:hypothetical protein